MCFKAVDRVEGRATRWDDSAGFLMATEKTTGRQAVDYGNQITGLHNVRDDLVGAVAEAPGRALRRGLYLPPRPAAILAAPGQHRGKGWRRRCARDDGPDASLSASSGSE